MGCNKPTDTSRKADKLALEIKNQINIPQLWTENWHAPVTLQKLVWKRLGAEEKARVVLSAKDERLIVSISDKPKSALPQTKAGNLKSLLRKCLGHIDDENLYDEVMKVLYDN